MSAGFVKLRRGILDHLPYKLTPDECLCYIVIILLADHRTGSWRGCAQAIARRTGWSIRQCQAVLKSLRVKGYVVGQPSTGRGQYLMRVQKYFEKVHGGAPSEQEGAPGCAFPSQKVHGGAPYQEVKTYKKKREEVNPRKNGAASRSIPEQEQRRRIEAKQNRLDKESEFSRELYVGSGPVCVVPDLWDRVKQLARKKAL